MSTKSVPSGPSKAKGLNCLVRTEQTHAKSDTSSLNSVLLGKDIVSPSSLGQPGMSRELSKRARGSQVHSQKSGPAVYCKESGRPCPWTRCYTPVSKQTEREHRTHANRRGAKSPTRATTDKIKKHIKDDTL